MGSETAIQTPGGSNVIPIQSAAAKTSRRNGKAKVTSARTRIRSGKSGPPRRRAFTCTKAYREMVENVQREGAHLARQLGFAPGRDLFDRVTLEESWWRSAASSLGYDQCEAICDNTSLGLKKCLRLGWDKESRNHHRFAVLDIARMLLDPESDIDGMGLDWYETFDMYLEVAHYFVKTAAPRPSKSVLREYAVIDRNQRKIAALEEQAEAKIKEIRTHLDAEKKRSLISV
jgi:hypothetical protein